MAYEEIVKSFVEENLVYHKSSGDFTWANDRAGGKVKAGGIAGSVNKGYRQIKIDGRGFKAHRIVWLLETGEWPEGQIDHINRDKLDNRFYNLRDVDNYTNCLNRSRRSSSGQVGVTFDKFSNKWLAQTYIDGKARNLGRFNSIDEAVVAYKEANKGRLQTGNE